MPFHARRASKNRAWRYRHIVALGCFVGGIAFASPSMASPWTVPDDEFSLSLAYDFQFASQEYLRNSTRQNFPLEGEFASSNISLGGRYGFNDQLEGFFQLNFKQVSYASRSFLPELQPTAGQPTVEETRAGIQDFSDSSVGAGDIFLGGRYNLHSGTLQVAVEGLAKLPTGYEDPTGTTVTRGDGQIDLQPSLLLGAYISPTASFARLDAGYNVRFGGPGHQATGALRVGQFIGESVILLAGVSGAYTIFEGRSVDGESNFVATDPDIPYQEFGADDFEIRPLYLDRSFAKAEGGVIFRLRRLELQLAYSYVFWGENIPALHGLNVTSIASIPDATSRREDEDVAPSEEIIEEVIIEEVPVEDE